MAPLKEFKKKASEAECFELADALGTTPAYLFNQLGVHRGFTLEKAISVEMATAAIAAKNGGTTPVIARDQLLDKCAKCPYACAYHASTGGL